MTTPTQPSSSGINIIDGGRSPSGLHIVFIDGKRYIQADVKPFDKVKRNAYARAYRKRRLIERNAMTARLNAIDATTAIVVKSEDTEPSPNVHL